jgi:hypothetical protein
MVDKKISHLPLDLDDDAGEALWDTLGEMDREEPPAELRQSFYRRLERESQGNWLSNLRDTLGLHSNAGWLTATACLLVGLLAGQLSFNGSNKANDDADVRLAALERNIAELNRRLILDRLDDSAPGTRLRGIMDAASFAGNDIEIANALLVRATQDRVPSVRSAAIDALGSSTNAPAMSEQIMGLLVQARSPIVQLALVDLVLRYGNEAQIEHLLVLADEDRLHPDLKRHVYASVQRDIA